MAINLFCRIFGHKFLKKIDKRVDGKDMTLHYYANVCCNCGLTKEEAGFAIIGSEK